MVDVAGTVSLVGYALGTFGGVLVFIEFFQTPSYISYDTDFGSYDLDLTPNEVDEYTWAGRIGALLIALAFALQFVAGLL